MSEILSDEELRDRANRLTEDRCEDGLEVLASHRALQAKLAEVELRRSETVAMCGQLQTELTNAQAKLDEMEIMQKANKAIIHNVATERNQLQAKLAAVEAERDEGESGCKLYLAEMQQCCDALAEASGLPRTEVGWKPAIQHLQQRLTALEEALKAISTIAQDDLREAMRHGDALHVLEAMTGLFNRCREQAQHALKGTP